MPVVVNAMMRRRLLLIPGDCELSFDGHSTQQQDYHQLTERHLSMQLS